MKAVFPGLAGLFLAAALLLAPAAEARKARRRPTKEGIVPAQPALPAVGLKPGRWLPKVKRTVEAFIAVHGNGNPGYSIYEPPVAVLSWGNVAVANDADDILFLHLITEAEFKFDAAFFKLIPAVYGRQRIFAGYEVFKKLPRKIWEREPMYNIYRKAFLKAYGDMCSGTGLRECWTWQERLLRGFEEGELQTTIGRVIEKESSRPLSTESVAESPQDKSPVRLRRGLRPVPEVLDLCRQLLKFGFDVWVVTADGYWTTLVLSRQFGIDPSRVVGIRTRVVNGVLTEEVVEPVPFRAGKVEAILRSVGRAPMMAIGSSENDRELLDYASGLRLLLDRGDEKLRAHVVNTKGLVQPAFD